MDLGNQYNLLLRDIIENLLILQSLQKSPKVVNIHVAQGVTLTSYDVAFTQFRK